MNEEQRLMYVRGMLLNYEIQLHAMITANKEREAKGEALAYGEEAFLKLVNYVNHNTILTELLGR